MSRLVVDASVAVKWYVPEVHADAALRLAEAGHDFVAPELLGAEVANVAWKKHRRGEMSVEEAVSIVRGLNRQPIEIVPHKLLLTDALMIAAAGHPLYDCLYLALAEREDCPLVTADRRFRAAFAADPLGERLVWIEAA